ncbi:hypothetical protein [Xanthomonas sacchari]|uniref:hypothetical protein n=1 Tax=Xanthomonas sacchari TaxID=56458 RepID=UPI003D1883FF
MNRKNIAITGARRLAPPEVRSWCIVFIARPCRKSIKPIESAVANCLSSRRPIDAQQRAAKGSAVLWKNQTGGMP